MTNLSRRLLPSTSALAAFESVARLGSFSSAADELSLTQGAISRQISGLEDQLGILLFERSSRGVQLTEAGRAYAKAIGAALAQIRTASLQAMTKRHGDTLNLAMLPTFGTRWLLPRIPRFVSAHPEITLNFATRIGIFDFEQDGLDVAIHIGQPNWPGAECTFLMDEMVAPVCSPEFLRQNPVSKPEDLAGLPLLHMASRPGAWTHFFEAVGVQGVPAPGMRFEQFASVAQACSAGLGVALMPLFLIEAELQAGTLVEAFPQQVRSPSSYYLVAPVTRMDLKPVALFRAWLIEEVGRWRNEPFYA
ncbi:LysR family transcriptional regulator [Rhizobium sp. Root149]|jgi:DNA-binding transcriptional LysR family regulator|uniref:LysR family transcriptional regulator n=1 Tax=Rhizobium TaxID=379 RepID=UPI0007145E33|nr:MULTISPECIES: LysR family transcriptional regulator [Rhizobium]KQZ49956.1 LysR family transcriptional regulator [Rhizobium sp. Root149]